MTQVSSLNTVMSAEPRTHAFKNLDEATENIGEKIVAQLRTVFDPEIPVNIYDLGLIYKIDINSVRSDDESKEMKFDATIDMTLTTPNCPVAGTMPGMVERAVAQIEELREVKINLTFDPPWSKDRMSDEARLHLNMY